MLPALDRCAVILSRFSGIAKFKGSNETAGFSSQQIGLITETVACLHLVCSKVLMQVVDELELFQSFSSWLRYEIDRLASNSSTTPSEEAADKESSIDHSKVLLYLQTVMTTSPLSVYFSDSSAEDETQSWKHVEQGVSLFEVLNEQLRMREESAELATPLTKVGLLCRILSRQASTVFSQIAEAEKRNVLFGKAHELGVAEKGAPMDMKLVKQVSIPNFTRVSLTSLKTLSTCEAYVAFVPNGHPNSSM